MKPLLLLSNDDGIAAPGIGALRTELSRFADVIVCAPTSEQSASSHALTLNSVLRLERIDESAFSIDGTPADCVYVALHAGTRVLPRTPDMVVSGMNRGPNLGVDVVYSGTVAAAREGAHRNIHAIAVSAAHNANQPNAAALGAKAVQAAWQELSANPRDNAALLNINIPPGDAWELKATRLGRRLYEDDVVFRKDPRGREYLWIGGSNVRHDRTDGTDTDAWEAGHASLTSLTLAMGDTGHADLCRAVAQTMAP